jgi:hypothetical protein
MNDGVVAICAHEARSACAGEKDLMERIRKAMKAARGHWMVTDPHQQFRAAVAAAVLESEGEERSRIERSAQALNKLGAALQALQAGVPVDLAGMVEKQDDDLIPLQKMWHDTAGPRP